MRRSTKNDVAKGSGAGAPVKGWGEGQRWASRWSCVARGRYSGRVATACSSSTRGRCGGNTRQDSKTVKVRDRTGPAPGNPGKNGRRRRCACYFVPICARVCFVVLSWWEGGWLSWLAGWQAGADWLAVCGLRLPFGVCRVLPLSVSSASRSVQHCSSLDRDFFPFPLHVQPL